MFHKSVQMKKQIKKIHDEYKICVAFQSNSS